MVRALLICSLYNIASFRRLCSTNSENIAYRWFCFLTIDDPVFGHSSISHFIDRFGRDGFGAISEGLNDELLRLGLLSPEMYADGSLVKANVSSNDLSSSGTTVEEFREQSVEVKEAITQAQVVVQEQKRIATLDPEWKWSNCAVISRNWDQLDPVRALCKREEVPVQLSREDFTATWQPRETPELLEWTRRPGSLLRAEDLSDWLQQQPAGPWNDLLLEAVENYGIETSNETLPSTAFREWLAEWARDNRRRQHGLLLTSAHRAKGLEFEHVVILDGNWQNVTGGEDSDAPRRLYYMAMTRAKRTLTLAKVGNSNPFLRDLRGHTSVQVRPEQDNVPPAPPEMKRKYLRLSLRDVNLSFAGRRRPEDPVHQAIKRLSPGDPLRVKTDKNPWELAATDGTIVGRLAQSFDVPEGVNEASAIKLAIATWDKERSEGQYQHLLKCDRWEVVIPEIVLP